MIAVVPEGVEQRSDAAASDEGHDDVDSVGRLDLRPQLVPQIRLAGRVREERRVEQWDQWLGNRLRVAIGSAAEDRVQHRRRIDGRSRGVDLDQLAETVEERTGHLDADTGTIGLADVGQGTLDLSTQMPGDPVGSLSGVEHPLLGRQSFGQRLQARLEPFSDEDLVQARRELLHGPNATSSPQSLQGSLARSRFCHR